MSRAPKTDLSFQGACARTLELLADLADRHAPCPTNDAIAEALGLSSATKVTRILATLETRDLVTVERRGNRRHITVRATGKSTAPTRLRGETAVPAEAKPTGAELAADIRAAAQRAGLSLNRFVAPLAADPARFVEQLSRARQPLPRTIARIRALIAGEPVPPPHPNFIRHAQPRRRVGAADHGADGQANAPVLASHLHCPRCGARDGATCGCARPKLTFVARPTNSAAVPPRPTGRLRTFEEQLAAVAAGAGLIEVAPLARPAPMQTLGGIGSAML